MKCTRQIILYAVLLILLGEAGVRAAPSHTVVLTWTASPDAGVAYTIYRASSACASSPTFVKLASGITALTYTDTAVSPGTYCYQATATLNGAESVPSNQASAVVLPAPPAALTVTSAQ